ncbi:hypothetical protein BDZ89DRAFT_1157802 [Hymenopellis radicata]|nr:hypothetical protein BDZ89DRAFT_1157802 [Hymenopellis radicata]
MVFGFFSRKASDDTQAQLRTPSPSVDGHLVISGPVSPPPATPSPPPDASTSAPTTSEGLATLISSIPPQTLHTYTLTRLESSSAPPSPTTISSLNTFFSKLEPPPKLHCIRCHKFYYDVENSDRSCLVPHDDDSADVERVGGRYETLYGCCGKTVEGDGDMGPPDGYCYEGKHTTDPKRARFRADSTIHDDKLTSCTSLKCFAPPTPSSPSQSSESVTSRRRTTTRKRARPQSMAQKAEEDEAEDVTVANDTETASVLGTPSSAAKPRRKKRAKTTSADKAFKPSLASDEDEEMDIDDAASSASKPKRKSRPRAKKGSPSQKPFPTSTSTSPILKPTRMSASPTRSTGHGRNVSFSSVSVVVTRR